MTGDWQDFAALGCVALAAAYLILRARAALSTRAKAGCGSCSGCPTDSRERPTDLVAIDSIGGRRKRFDSPNGRDRMG